MLDKLPAPLRHFSLMLISALLGWASTNLADLNLDPLVAGLLGVFVAQALAFVTPLTKQYGVGLKK